MTVVLFECSISSVVDGKEVQLVVFAEMVIVVIIFVKVVAVVMMVGFIVTVELLVVTKLMAQVGVIPVGSCNGDESRTSSLVLCHGCASRNYSNRELTWLYVTYVVYVIYVF